MKHAIGKGNVVQETSGKIVLETPHLSLAFSKTTGDWTGLCDRRTGYTWMDTHKVSPSLSLRIGGKTKRPSGVFRNSRLPFIEDARNIGAARRFLKYESTPSETGAAVRLLTQENDWTFAEIFTVDTESDRIEREVEIAYHGAETIPLREVTFIVPEIRVDPAEDWTVEAPGYPVRPRFPVSEMSFGEWGGTSPSLNLEAGTAQQDADAPAAKPGVIGFHNAKNNQSLLCWAFSQEFPSILALDRTGKGIRIRQDTLAAQWVQPSSTVRVGKQILFLRNGLWSHCLKRFQKQWASLGISTPDDRPAWSRNIAIYEVHIGNAAVSEDRNYEPYPNIEDLTADLERIRSLGFDTLLLMPRQPYPGYTVHDFLDAKTTYGDDGDLKQLVTRAHSLGLRVLLDFVMHGCIDKDVVRWQEKTLGNRFRGVFDDWLRRAPDRSPYREEHPEWFVHDEDGEIAKVYTAAFDHNNSDWQDFIIRVLTHYVTKYDIDGFRTDAPTWNFMPNWDRSLPYPAGCSIYGAARLFQRARSELKRLKPDLVLYTEPGGPLFRRDFDLNYNYDEQWLFPALVPVLSPRGLACETTLDRSRITARDLVLWLEDRRNVLPPGSITVHHLDSHDTFWWGGKAQFRSEAFGRKAASGLFALCALLDGGVMNYAGGENGAEEFYRRVLRLRREIPEIRSGTCRYTSAKADREEVFTVCWETESACAVPVINLSDSSVSFTVGIPTLGEAPAYDVYDAFTGKVIAERRVPTHSTLSIASDLDVYEVQLLLVRPAH